MTRTNSTVSADKSDFEQYVSSNIQSVRMRKLTGVWTLSLYVYKVTNIEERLGLPQNRTLLARKRDNSPQNKEIFCNKMFWESHGFGNKELSAGGLQAVVIPLSINTKIIKAQCLQGLSTPVCHNSSWWHSAFLKFKNPMIDAFKYF